MKETQKSMVLYYVQDEKKRIQMEVLCMSMSIGTKQLKPSDLNTQVGTLIGAKNIEPLDPAKEAKAPAIFCMPEIIIFSGISDKKLDEFLFSYKKVGMTPTKLKAVITPQNASWSLYHLIRELSMERAQIEAKVKRLSEAKQERE